MGGWKRLAFLISLTALAVDAGETQLDQNEATRQRCEGMYSRQSWGGALEPFILIKFKNVDVEGDADPIASLAIFEWGDEHLLGKPLMPDTPEQRQYICDDQSVAAKLCNETAKGSFILADDAESISKTQILTMAVHLKKPDAITYPVRRTGYYCVGTFAYTDDDYTALVEFRNAYGELPAAQIAKLPFYGGLTIVYAVVGVFWAFLYVQNRHDILAVQNYITAILVFLVVEMLMTWGYYDYQNRHGSTIGAKFLMVVVSILSAARNSFSFFLLLIVCMGYGVVKPSLGKTMIAVRGLAIAHFVFGIIYVIASLTVKPDEAGPWILLVILPLSATLTAFYIWTLNSLNYTMKDLFDRKQRVKATMYRKLWWCILISILVIFGFFFFNSFTFVGSGTAGFVPSHWQTRWFILDGWLNLVYLADVSYIAYLWRPTANNRRFAMSDEIAQDDEGFEIASVRDSLDEEDAPQTGSGGSENAPPAYDPAPRNRDESHLPAPRPQKPVQLPRDSLDGETIFAVGEDVDKWSDDELEAPGNSDETKRLTGKGD